MKHRFLGQYSWLAGSCMHQFTTLVSSGCCCTSCQWKGHFWTPTNSTLLQFLPAVHWYRILPLGMVSSVDLVHLLMLQVIKEAYKLVLVSPPFQILTFLTCFMSLGMSAMTSQFKVPPLTPTSSSKILIGPLQLFAFCNFPSC